MEKVDRGRVQFSVRSLLLLTAAVALLLVPVAWVSRQRASLMRERDAILVAREVALRSVVQEEERRKLARAGPESGSAAAPAGQPSDASAEDQSHTMEQLRRENAALKQQNEALREDVRRIKAIQDQQPQSRSFRASN
jgi:hypothetical protein